MIEPKNSKDFIQKQNIRKEWVTDAWENVKPRVYSVCCLNANV